MHMHAYGQNAVHLFCFERIHQCRYLGNMCSCEAGRMLAIVCAARRPERLRSDSCHLFRSDARHGQQACLQQVTETQQKKVVGKELSCGVPKDSCTLHT
eukprot:2644214-Pleurochrysis_carterae.AAC.1